MSVTTKPAKLIAIDASTNSLAFAIFIDNNIEKIGKINFIGNNTYEKVMDAGKKTKSFFDFCGGFELLIIEQTIYMNSPKTVSDLALVQGAILAGAAMSGTNKIDSVPPITWQNYLGNKKLTKDEQFLLRSKNPGRTESWYKTYERNFRKERTIKLIDVIYDKKIYDNDVADAVGIGHYAVNNFNKLF